VKDQNRGLEIKIRQLEEQL
jgi:hypothetical protein